MRCCVESCGNEALGTATVDMVFTVPSPRTDTRVAVTQKCRVGFCEEHCDVLDIPADALSIDTPYEPANEDPDELLCPNCGGPWDEGFTRAVLDG